MDGPTLREIRRGRGVGLRQVAKPAGMSHGHLSQVERGVPGRAVTPSVLHAYSSALGVDLGEWKPGRLPDKERRIYLGKVAEISMGGRLSDALTHLVNAQRNMLRPLRLDERAMANLDSVATFLCDGMAGVVPGRVAQVLLGWLTELLYDVERYEPDDADVHVDDLSALRRVTARLAHRAGQQQTSDGNHGSARTLYTAALHLAGAADDAELRAQVLGDMAIQFEQLQDYEGAQQVARLGEVDERISVDTRERLQTVKKRAAVAEEELQVKIRAQIEASSAAPSEADA